MSGISSLPTSAQARILDLLGQALVLALQAIAAREQRHEPWVDRTPPAYAVRLLEGTIKAIARGVYDDSVETLGLSRGTDDLDFATDEQPLVELFYEIEALWRQQCWNPRAPRRLPRAPARVSAPRPASDGVDGNQELSRTLAEVCRRYGVQPSLPALLRHLDALHAAALNAKDFHLDVLRRRVVSARLRLAFAAQADAAQMPALLAELDDLLDATSPDDRDQVAQLHDGLWEPDRTPRASWREGQVTAWLDGAGHCLSPDDAQRLADELTLCAAGARLIPRTQRS